MRHFKNVTNLKKEKLFFKEETILSFSQKPCPQHFKLKPDLFFQTSPSSLLPATATP
jgi:hypothetical protein